jgi:hypothetical protein
LHCGDFEPSCPVQEVYVVCGGAVLLVFEEKKSSSINPHHQSWVLLRLWFPVSHFLDFEFQRRGVTQKGLIISIKNNGGTAAISDQ